MRGQRRRAGHLELKETGALHLGRVDGVPSDPGGRCAPVQALAGRPRNRQVFSRSRAVFDRSNSTLSITLGQRLFSCFLKTSRERQSGAGVDAECLLLLQRELLSGFQGCWFHGQTPSVLQEWRKSRAGQGLSANQAPFLKNMMALLEGPLSGVPSRLPDRSWPSQLQNFCWERRRQDSSEFPQDPGHIL